MRFVKLIIIYVWAKIVRVHTYTLLHFFLYFSRSIYRKGMPATSKG